MDRILSTTTGDDFNRPFARPPMDTFINDKLRKKIAKKHLHHLIEKRCLVESIDSFDKFILESNELKNNLSNLHNNLQKSYRDPHLAQLRHLGQLLLSMEHSTSIDGGPINLRNLSSRFWRRETIQMLLYLCCILKRGINTGMIVTN